MTDRLPPPDRDLSLLGLAEQVRSYVGHIEDMPGGRRVFLLGQFEGATSRAYASVREIYAEYDEAGYMEALPALHQVMLALGAPEDWHE